MLLMAQTVAPETGGGEVRRTFTALEPRNCKADSSELLTTQTQTDTSVLMRQGKNSLKEIKCCCGLSCLKGANRKIYV